MQTKREEREREKERKVKGLQNTEGHVLRQLSQIFSFSLTEHLIVLHTNPGEESGF